MRDLTKKFPSYFSLFTLPPEAEEKEILVYRACRTQKADRESFLPWFEQNNFEYLAGEDPKNASVYSLSTYENPRHVKRFVTLDSDFQVPFKIASGMTNVDCGVILQSKSKKSSHVDWWIYEGAKPHEGFTIIEDFESFLKEYKKSKEGL